MKVNASIFVQLSSNDALSSKACKELHNSPRIEIATLGVGDEGIATAFDDERSQIVVT